MFVEDWTFFEAFYYCVIPLTTIGFGDYVPRSSNKEGFGGYSDEISIALCSVYLLFGISLLVMTFNLMQEEVSQRVRNVGRNC